MQLVIPADDVETGEINQKDTIVKSALRNTARHALSAGRATSAGAAFMWCALPAVRFAAGTGCMSGCGSYGSRPKFAGTNVQQHEIDPSVSREGAM